MAHLDTVSTSPVRADAGSAAGAAPRATDRMSARGLSWRALVVALLVAGAILAQTGPAATLADGSTLDVHSVGDTLTRAGNGWLLALSWFGGVIALVSTVVFPRRERFIQAIAISAGALIAAALPAVVWSDPTRGGEGATGLGTGLGGALTCFAVAAVLPWVALLAWDRAKPLLGVRWEKWLFLLPAIVWVFALTVFPLIYAFSTSRYAFRYGTVNRFVGWENFRKLFIDGSLGGPLLSALGAALAVGAIAVGLRLLVRWASERELGRADLREALGWAPLVAVPAAIVSLGTSVLRPPLNEQLTITFTFVAGAVAMEMVLGLLIALLMDREIRGRGVLRAVMTLPIFATPIALGYLARGIFYEEGGPLNSGLGSLGIGQPPWISDPEWARLATIIVDVWQWTPFVFIIALAGLQGLPRDVIEASEVDGATSWQILRFVTLPLMAPILWLILLLRSIDAFKVFDVAYGLTLGGPGRATEYYSLFNYRTARQFFNFGEAAAQAFLLLVIVMVLVSLLWSRIRHVYEDEGSVA